MISAESGSELAVNRSKHRTDKYARHRESVAYAFGHGDDVGLDTVVLMGEELAATSVTALDFVQNQYRIVLCTGLAQGLHKLVGGQLYAAYSLNAFDDYSAYIAFRQFGFHCLCIIQREIGNVSAVVDGSNDFGIVGCLYRQ